MDPIKFPIREAKGADLNFIYKAWTESFRYHSGIGKTHRNHVFFTEYPKVIDQILSSPDTKVLIVNAPDQEDVIIGFLAYAPLTIHYVFVKNVFKRMGIATALINRAFPDPNTPIIYTHETFEARDALKSKPRFIHDHFKLMKKGDSQYGTRPSTKQT